MSRSRYDADHEARGALTNAGMRRSRLPNPTAPIVAADGRFDIRPELQLAVAISHANAHRHVHAASSVGLACWPEENLVDVHVVRLAYREDDSPSERIRRDGGLVNRFHAGRDVLIGNGVGQLRCYRPGDTIVVRML